MGGGNGGPGGKKVPSAPWGKWGGKQARGQKVVPPSAEEINERGKESISEINPLVKRRKQISEKVEP